MTLDADLVVKALAGYLAFTLLLMGLVALMGMAHALQPRLSAFQVAGAVQVVWMSVALGLILDLSTDGPAALVIYITLWVLMCVALQVAPLYGARRGDHSDGDRHTEPA